MADKHILKLTNLESVVKVDNTVGSVTFDLATDFKLAHEDISGTPRVNIRCLMVAGTSDATVTITRNSKVLWVLFPGPPFDLQAVGISDSLENDSNIVITTAGTSCQLVMLLKKVEGYKTRYTPEQTGSDIFV